MESSITSISYNFYSSQRLRTSRFSLALSASLRFTTQRFVGTIYIGHLFRSQVLFSLFFKLFSVSFFNIAQMAEFSQKNNC